MNGNLTVAAAFLLGLFASGHCVLMCGGLSGALTFALRDATSRRPRWSLLLALQAGRVASYMSAAVLLAGAGAALLQFVDHERVRWALRVFAAITFVLVALAMLGKARGVDFAAGQALWKHLAPLARRFMPARAPWQAFALGALWGWMPCGFVYSVLLLAWTSMDPWRSAAIMLAFGLGTMPALLASNFGAAKALRLFGRTRARSALASGLLLMAVLTLAGPWLTVHAGAHATQWLPFDCVVP